MFKISKQNMSLERKGGILCALKMRLYARILIYKHTNVFCEKRNVIIKLHGKGRILAVIWRSNYNLYSME